MIKSENVKIVTVSFVTLSFLIGLVARVLFETLSVVSGFVANYWSMDTFRHGIPVAFALATFVFCQTKPEVKKISDEVVSEVRKVVWPTKKELYSMVSVVTMILLVSGVLLGIFDLVSGTGIRFIME